MVECKSAEESGSCIATLVATGSQSHNLGAWCNSSFRALNPRKEFHGKLEADVILSFGHSSHWVLLFFFFLFFISSIFFYFVVAFSLLNNYKYKFVSYLLFVNMD